MLRLACPEFLKGYGCIQIVENMHRMREREYLVDDARALGTVAAHNDRVRISRLLASVLAYIFPLWIKDQMTVVALRKISALGVVGHISFEKSDFVPSSCKRPQQGAIGRCMPIAPGGRQRKAEQCDLHQRAPILRTCMQDLVFHLWFSDDWEGAPVAVAKTLSSGLSRSRSNSERSRMCT